MNDNYKSKCLITFKGILEVYNIVWHHPIYMSTLSQSFKMEIYLICLNKKYFLVGAVALFISRDLAYSNTLIWWDFIPYPLTHYKPLIPWHTTGPLSPNTLQAPNSLTHYRSLIPNTLQVLYPLTHNTLMALWKSPL